MVGGVVRQLTIIKKWLHVHPHSLVRALHCHLVSPTSQNTAKTMVSYKAKGSYPAIGTRDQSALTPISNIPPEILGAVFHLLAPDSLSESKKRKWIYISHVSQQWRTVALSIPSLWRKIRNDWPVEMALEFLRRSQSADISVRVQLPSYGGPYVSGLMHHWSRVVELNIVISSYVRPDIEEPYLGQLAPRLKFLTIWHHSLTDGLPSEPIAGLGTFLFGCVPQLRRLQFSRFFSAPWPTQVPSSLTHLLIDMEVNNPGDMPTWHQLFALLKPLHNLRVLQLECIRPRGPRVDATCQDKVHLDRLNLFKIKASAFACCELVSHITIPVQCALLMSASDNYEASNELVRDRLMNIVISRHYALEPTRQIPDLLSGISLNTSYTSFHYSEYRFPSSVDPTAFTGRGDCWLELYHLYSGYNHDYTPLLQRLLSAIMWDQVDGLRLCSPDNVLEHRFNAHTAPFPALQAINTDASMLLAVLNALYRSRSGASKSTSGALSGGDQFPHLRTIRIGTVGSSLHSQAERVLSDILDTSDELRQSALKVCHRMTEPFLQHRADVIRVACPEDSFCVGCLHLELSLP